jgi:hypothetical protein
MSQESDAMRFVYAFMQHVDEMGIFDAYDPDENAMVTSDEMTDLINMATMILPERLEPEEAAQKMRLLSKDERDFFIGEDQEHVIDMRDEFNLKMVENRGARGLLSQLVAAQSRGDLVEMKRLMETAKEFDERV